MNPIGIMQGRLSRPVDDRIQSFPELTWRDEFGLAKLAGLDRIEWIWEVTEAANPLATDEGVLAIRQLAQQEGVEIRSVCGDRFMQDPLLDPLGSPREAAVDHLRWLVGRASKVGCDYVLLPFVDASSIGSLRSLDGLAAALKATLPEAHAQGIELHIESDASPRRLRSLLEGVGDASVRVTIDIGNSASLGADPVEEIGALGPWIGSVHIKDRLRGGTTVPLGSGSADFEKYFALLRELGYSGPFILQVARSEPGGELEWARRNRAFVEAAIRSAAVWGTRA